MLNNTLVKVNEDCTVIVLECKDTYQDFIKIVLCAIVGRKEYVTWILNTGFNLGSGFISGHYYTDLESALKDYNKRS